MAPPPFTASHEGKEEGSEGGEESHLPLLLVERARVECEVFFCVSF
jgi:hypothetical protein